MKYNIHNQWDPLETIVLGDFYLPEFFEGIKNQKIKSGLCKIAEEAQEDLEQYQAVLQQFGVEVLRPKIDKNDSILNYVNKDGKLRHRSGAPASPLQPRDRQVVIGNELFCTNGFSQQHPAIPQLLKDYSNEFVQFTAPLNQKQYNNYRGTHSPDWPDYYTYLEKYIFEKPYTNNAEINSEIEQIHINEPRYETFYTDGPSITMVGKDIYIDQLIWRTPDFIEKHTTDHYYTKFRQRFDKHRINTLHIGGHSDGCFHTLKPGVLISINEIQNYDVTFPDWDVLYIDEPRWRTYNGFRKMKAEINGKWWIPEQEDNHELTHFIETVCNNWTGFLAESVFDVNLLVVDQHHVLVSEINDEVDAFLKKHKMEPILIPWRHKFFFDGGIHCITLDLKRKGVQQDYFPQRTKPVIDKGYDFGLDDQISIEEFK